MQNNHKQWVSAVFDRTATTYGQYGDAFFDYFGQALVNQVKLQPDQTILDVATGRGAVLYPLTKAVGASGKLVGIDISPVMIQETSKELAKKNLEWVDLRCMDAEELDFPDASFDAVFCGFALFFLPDIPKALAEFKRVLRPGGILAVSTWGEDSQVDQLIGNAFKIYDNPKGIIATPLWSGEELKKVLTDAEFVSLSIVEETKQFFYHSLEELWDRLWNQASRARLEQLTLVQLLEFRNLIFQEAQKYFTPQGIPEELQVFYGFARKPSIERVLDL